MTGIVQLTMPDGKGFVDIELMYKNRYKKNSKAQVPTHKSTLQTCAS